MAGKGARGRGGWLRAYLLTVALTAMVIVVVANVPVTTKQGVNFEVSEHRLPLYVKTFEFLDRHTQYRQIAAEATRGAVTDADKLQAVFDWTARRIQPTPETWTIVDDHILNIIIRGYGSSDQRADVCATLLTYAGVPAYWQRVNTTPDRKAGAIFTRAFVGGRWVVFDVASGFLFRTSDGRFAEPVDFAAHRVVVPAAAADLLINGVPYTQVLDAITSSPAPRTLRAELQMPWPRLWYMTKRAIGLEADHGSEQ